MAQKWPNMTQNYPKWPKNDARIYALFPQFFFFNWKGGSAKFFAFRMYANNGTNMQSEADMCILKIQMFNNVIDEWYKRGPTFLRCT